ncbi:TPA: hypothetical protein RJ957_002430 [Enterobacter hormaechei]|nr:hypothetical protein [Enterobacter hormaechei]
MTKDQYIEILETENRMVTFKLEQKQRDYDQLEKTYQATHDLLEKTLINKIKETNCDSL